MKRIIRKLAILLGICLCTYPLVANLLEQRSQGNVISTYEDEVKKYDEDRLEQFIQEAEEYNKELYEVDNIGISGAPASDLSSDNYNEILNFSGNSVMGKIDIPQIKVHLPIYHGTGEDVLSAGIGHLEGTSFPVGGENTHCVLTGHRGLPNSKLFTRLDELEKEDLFFLEVGQRIMAYRIIEIQVIEPDDVKSLTIEPQKDKVSLITCTPYGVNSHRLVVTGERTEYKESIQMQIKPEIASKREILFVALPFIMVGAVAVKIIKERRKGKREKKKKCVDSVTTGGAIRCVWCHNPC